MHELTRRIRLGVVAAFCVTLPTAAAAEEAGAAEQVFPFVLPWDDVSPGVTDLSGWLPRPAGQRGFVRVGEQGHFYLGNERIRFFGVNMSFGAGAPTKADAPGLAGRLAKFGLNIVRFHHLDTGTFPNGIRSATSRLSGELDAEALDRMDYFIHQLKTRGIYANLNLLVGRPFNAADGMPPEIEKLDWKDRHIIGFFDPKQLELQKEYARSLLRHTNSYTGAPYATEPAVAFVEINNEQGLVHAWLGGQVDSLPEVFREALRVQWNQWLECRRSSQSSLPTRRTFNDLGASAQQEWMAFMVETEGRYWDEMRRFLKEDVGIKAPITGTIAGCSPINLQARMDWVDTHSYWQHPRFPRRQWDSEDWIVENRTMVNTRGGTLAGLALRRVLGKPHALTEYNHPAPNTFSSEGFLLMAAYAALQDWDAIYVYSYAHTRNEGWDLRRISSFFDIDQHPTKMASIPPAVAMFVRGDVQPGRELVCASLPIEREVDLLRKARAWDLVHAGHVGLPRESALIHPVAIAAEGQSAPASALAVEQDKAAGSRFVSDTGELVWDIADTNRGVVTVSTPGSKAVIGYGGGKRFELGEITIEPGPSLQDGWCAITVTRQDGKGLSGASAAGPQRFLVTATGYAENTGMVWKNPEKSSVGREWGRAPSRVEGIRARLTWSASSARLRAWALDERGQRKAPLRIGPAPGGKAAVTIGPAHRTLWYEIALEP